MKHILITALLLANMHATMAMQKVRTIIRNKPVTTMLVTAATTSALTWGVIHSEELGQRYRDAQKQPIRRTIAAEHAQLSLTFSDR